MKFVHMADLHIGVRLGEFDLLSDQRAALEGIAASVERAAPDVICIAGDVYDRAVPPAEAVLLLDQFLTRLSGVAPTLVIAGNHDSPERLCFGSRLLAARGLHIAGRYDGRLARVTITDAWGPVDVWLMPFFRPREIAHLFDEPHTNCDGAVRAVLAREAIDFSRRNMLLAHHFVTSGGAPAQLSDSESTADAVGGLDAVDVSAFDGFCYVALGHLHAAQRVGRDTVRYAGSPLKYSFSECAHKKGLTYGEMDETGGVTLRREEIPFLHDVREIRGALSQLVAPQVVASQDSGDYLKVTLTDAVLPVAPREQLEAVYSRIVKLDIERLSSALDAQDAVRKALSPMAQFQAFYRAMSGRDMGEDALALARAVLERAWEGNV